MFPGELYLVPTVAPSTSGCCPFGVAALLCPPTHSTMAEEKAWGNHGGPATHCRHVDYSWIMLCSPNSCLLEEKNSIERPDSKKRQQGIYWVKAKRKLKRIGEGLSGETRNNPAIKVMLVLIFS